MKCPTCGYKLAVYKTLADKQANSVTRYYKCSHCSATAVGHEEIISDKEGIMDSKFADMISWCQAIANAYEAYSKGRMSKEVYLAIFKEKLKDKPDLRSIEKLSDWQKCRAAAVDIKVGDVVTNLTTNGGR